MTKDQLQAELKKKVKPGLKPSHLRKSKSADSIPVTLANIPLKKSQSQLVIPLPNEPSLTQQISSLQDELTTERKKVDLLREDLASSQEKTKQLKATTEQLQEQILQLRLDKIKEFGDYLEKKQDLATELAENIQAGTEEIARLENKLLTTNKKKLELQQKLGTAESKVAQLELQLLNGATSPTSHLLSDYWPVILIALLYCGSAWLLSKNTHQ